MSGWRAVAALLAAQPSPGAEVRLRRQLCAEAAAAAYERGYRDGFERAMDQRAGQPSHFNPSAPTLAELELLRWGPGGREHFGDPRPTDRIGNILKARDGAA